MRQGFPTYRILRRPGRAAAGLLATAILCQGAAAFAQTTGASATAEGQSTAHVVRPLTVAAARDLDFGMVVSSGAGSVSVEPGETEVRYGGGARKACVGADPCPQAHPARFAVSGEAGRSYRIAIPESLNIAGRRSGGETPGLLVVTMTARTASRPGAGAEGTLDEAGTDTFEVGGTLELPAPLPPAHYTVPVTVIVTYS